MLNKLTQSSIASCLFAFSGMFSANAADVLQEQTIQQEISAPVYSQASDDTGYSWDGFYIGAKLGYDFSRKIQFTINGPREIFHHNNPSITFLDNSSKGLVGSAFLGFNGEMGNGFIVGIDSSVSYSGARNDFYFLHDVDKYLALKPAVKGQNKPSGQNLSYYSIHDDLGADLSARLGYAVTPNFMLYAIGGGTVNKVTLSREELHPAKVTSYLFGWSAGAGLDIRLAEQVFLRGEYRYLTTLKKDIKFEDVHDQLIYNIDEKINRVSLGIALKF